jgi:hypothetical protein
VLEEADQVRQLYGPVKGREPLRQEIGRCRAVCSQCLCAAELGLVEPPRPRCTQPANGEIGRVEGLKGVVYEDLFPGRPCAVLQADGPVDNVKQFRHGDSRRSPLVEVLVASFKGYDEVFGRREQGIEEKLSVLAWAVPVPNLRAGKQQVVAVLGCWTWKEPVVEAEQANHAVRHRAHGDQRADRHVAGAEASPGGPASKSVGEQSPGLG